MKHFEFVELLKAKGHSHKAKGDSISITQQGPVYLDSLTSLPEGTKFENQGPVYLDSLTSLPEGTKFENQGSVYLDSLTSLPEGTKFENQGPVDLRGLTSLPEGTKFENQGSVYLYSLTGTHSYLGQGREFRHVDGYTMLFVTSKSFGGHTVHSARYFGGGPISELKKCYVAESNGIYAHGSTMKDAVEDLQYKLADHADKGAIVAKIRATEKVTLAQFRALTGACREGVRHHLEMRGINLDKIEFLELAEALKLMAGTSYGETFSHLTEREATQ